jgi:hypothetical protein
LGSLFGPILAVNPLSTDGRTDARFPNGPSVRTGCSRPGLRPPTLRLRPNLAQTGDPNFKQPFLWNLVGSRMTGTPETRVYRYSYLRGSLEGGEFRILNCHEMALELGCGADFWCNRHCRTSPVVLEGFWGQVWPKIGGKPAQTGPEIRIQDCRTPGKPEFRTATVRLSTYV